MRYYFYFNIQINCPRVTSKKNNLIFTIQDAA